MIKAGPYSYGSPIFSPFHTCDVIIGNFVGFADNVSIDTGGEHNTGVISCFPFHALEMFAPWVEGMPLNTRLNKGPVIIGNDVWIGEGVRILTGTRIGDGAVIGTRAVVAGEIPPYAIAVGIPARVLRYRFSQEQIEKLLRIKWWNWPLEKIRKNEKLLVSNDIDALERAARE